MAYNTAYTETKTVQPNAKSFGKVAYGATAITTTDYTKIDCGFKPTKITWVNLTDRITVEWFAGMTASQLLKTAAAGTRTLDTTANAMVVTSVGFELLQDGTLGAIAASKDCYYIAEA